jgi:tetratricopeptide (TPR) repeat protein
MTALMRSRSRSWYLGAAAAAATLIVVGLLLARVPLTPRSAAQRALAELVSAADQRVQHDESSTAVPRRLVSGRLSTSFAWAPPPSALRTSAATVPATVLLPASRIEQAVRQERSAENLQAYATAQLILDSPSTAVPALEEAVHLAPDVPAMWVDLAVASFEHAQRADEAIYLPRALEAANTAISLRGSDAAAWFNKALILERLNVSSQAAAAWGRFLALEAQTAWAAEARTRLASLDKRAMDQRAADIQPQRDGVLDDILNRWAAAELAGDRAGSLAAVAEAGRAAGGSGGPGQDRFVKDLVASLAELTPSRRRVAARGHAAYSAARARYRQDDYEGATPLFAAAERDLAAVISPAVHVARLHGAILRYRRNDHSGAIASLRALRTAIDGLSYFSIRGRASWVEGLALEVTGLTKQATPKYDDAIRDLRLSGELANASFVQGILASQYDRLGSPTRAWQAWAESLAGTPREGTLMTASISATELGWHRAALDLQRAAIDLARGTNRPTTLADGLRWYAITSARLGRVDEARDALNEARATAAGWSGAAWERIRAEIDVAQAVSSGVFPPAARVTAATSALTYFEQSGATWRAPEILLARATVRQANGETDAAYADLKRGLGSLARLRESIAPGVDQMTFADVVRRLVSAFVEFEEGRGLMREAFDVVEDAHGRDLSQNAPMVSLDQLEVAMPPGVVLLQFVVGETRSFVWVVQHSGSSSFRIDVGQRELAALVDAMGPPRFDRAAAVNLRKLLLGHALGVLPKDGLLVVIPDGPLHLVSFGMLPGARTGYLIEEHPILVAPSARSWLAASVRLDGYKALPSRAFVAGNPRIDRERYGNLPTLRFAEEEARSVAALYRVAPTLGADVTREVVASAVDAEVLHFSGHAVVNSVRPSQSALVVWDPDGPGLVASGISASNWSRTRLIVLAACRGAAGLMTRTEGAIGLARAFLAAGGPSVVASQWDVDDRSSKDLFVRFHQEYSKTGNAAASLRAAQVAMIHSDDPTLQQPRNWAGFVAFGGAPFTPSALTR